MLIVLCSYPILDMIMVIAKYLKNHILCDPQLISTKMECEDCT